MPRRTASLAFALALAAPVPALASRAEGRVVPRPEVADTLPGNYLAAVVAGASRDDRAAVTYFREALRADPRERELSERAFVAFLARGEMEDAYRLADRLAKADRRDGLVHLALGVRAIKAGRYEAARGLLAKGGRGRAADVTATLLTAWAYAGSKNFGEAVRTVDRLAGEDAFAVLRDTHAGLILDLAGDAVKARGRLQAAHRGEPGSLRLADARARFEAARGDAAEARRLYEDARRLAPRHPSILAGLRALDAGRPLERVAPDARRGAAEVLYGLAASGAGSPGGDDIAATVYLRLALDLDPAHDVAAVALADSYERARRYDESIAVYAAVPETSPLKRTAEIQIGLDLEAAGRPQEALTHLTKVLAAHPDDVDAVLALADLHRAGKRFKEAVDAYTRAMDLIPNLDRGYWTVPYYRGMSYERLKDWPRAEADLLKALELNPDHPLILNYLGYSWVDQGLNLERAFTMLRRAVELRPRDGYIVDSLGWAHFRLGRFEDAVRELERAVELRPSDPVINDHLGDAYWRVGRRLEARFQWTHARDLKPEPEDLPAILAKLENGLPDLPATPAADAAPAPAPKDGG